MLEVLREGVMIVAENLPGGYTGKILRVDLSAGKISTDILDALFCRKYLGGSGFATYYLLKELKPGIDPLGPDNKLIFSLGPITGTSYVGSGRNSICAKSPQGNGIAMSEVGGFWGAELKRAGYDGIIVEGKAAKPVYLWVKDGEAVLKDAGQLWGKNTKETELAIRAELGDDKISVAMIGPAGENTVRFACIMNGLYDAAGRGGLGAVMGSKNLKAVAVRGSKQPVIANPQKLTALRQWMMANMYNFPMIKGIHEFGTGAGMKMMETTGNLPVRNFRDGLFPGVEKIDGKTIKSTVRVGMDGCFACPIRCKKKIKIEGKYPVDPDYGGPEYETLAALGSDCGVDDLAIVSKANELCNAYSMDTISAGGVIAFAMECFEKGLLTLKDTRGMELRFGNGEAMLKCLDLMARREGFGNLLAEGAGPMSQKIGQKSEDFAMQVKGVEAGLHDPRIKPAFGLGYMVNPNGADHGLAMQDQAYTTDGGIKGLKPLGIIEPLPLDDIGPRKVALLRLEQFKKVITNCLLLCSYTTGPYDNSKVAELTATITGWDTSVVEQFRVAERILTMARLFNMRHGLTAADDKLPLRFYQPKTDGVLVNKSLDKEKMEKARRYYYILMGWDPVTGIPLPEKLEELGIQ
jgi:aldehyde:ferredoxin oxidoreductase